LAKILIVGRVQPGLSYSSQAVTHMPLSISFESESESLFSDFSIQVSSEYKCYANRSPELLEPKFNLHFPNKVRDMSAGVRMCWRSNRPLSVLGSWHFFFTWNFAISRTFQNKSSNVAWHFV